MKLAEILIVIAILLLIVVVVTGSAGVFRARSALVAGADTVYSVLQDARAKTIASRDGMQYGVRLVSDSVTLFSGPVYQSAGEVRYVLPSSIHITSTTLAGGGVDVVFQKLTGKTAQFGTVSLQAVSDLASSKTITIEKSGVISVN